MIPVPSWVYRLLFISLGVAGLFGAGWWIGRDGAQDKARDAALVASAKAEEVRRATEGGWQKAHWDLAYKAEESRVERERQHQIDVDSLRAGTLRVRDRFVCPKAPASPTPAGQPESAQESGLLQSDIELLLRIGREADTIADERNQCIASYEALRGK